MISLSLLPAFICSRICLRKSSARSARESDSVSFWQTRQRNCSVRFFIRCSICGSSFGCASFAIASGIDQSKPKIIAELARTVLKSLRLSDLSVELCGTLCLCGEVSRERIHHGDTETSQSLTEKKRRAI